MLSKEVQTLLSWRAWLRHWTFSDQYCTCLFRIRMWLISSPQSKSRSSHILDVFRNHRTSQLFPHSSHMLLIPLRKLASCNLCGSFLLCCPYLYSYVNICPHLVQHNSYHQLSYRRNTADFQ